MPTANRPKVDISDRAAAADRYARLSIIAELLLDLGNMCYRDPAVIESLLDERPSAVETRRQLDWLGDLPAGFSPDAEECDPIGEMNALHDALFPAPEDGSDWEDTPESEATDARASLMTARLLFRMADHADWLRERAMERLVGAERMMGTAAEGLHDDA